MEEGGHLLKTGLRGTPLDQVTDMIFPKSWQSFLDTIVWEGKLLHINYWSSIHFGLGLVWGLYFHRLGVVGLLLTHTAFEMSQLILGQYFVKYCLTTKETVDVIVDTLVTVIGYVVGRIFSGHTVQ